MFAKAASVRGALLRNATCQLRRACTAKPASPRIDHVLLFSWFGARSKDIGKYEQLWRSTYGVPVTVFRPTVVQSLVPPLADRFAREAHRQALALRRPDGSPCSRLLVHSFSNGGFLSLTNVMLRDREDSLAAGAESGGGADAAKSAPGRLSATIRALVFDSAPSEVTPAVASKALMVVLFAGSNSLALWLGTLLEVPLAAYLQLVGASVRMDGMAAFWHRAAPRLPQLFLFSEADALTPAREVRAFMAEQEARGCKVRHHVWPNTRHVEHFRMQPEAYQAQLDAFVRELD